MSGELTNKTSDAILSDVLYEVEVTRIEAYNKLLKKLLPLGVNHAMDICNYFYGPNPEIENLTQNLLKEINLIK